MQNQRGRSVISIRKSPLTTPFDLLLLNIQYILHHVRSYQSLIVNLRSEDFGRINVCMCASQISWSIHAVPLGESLNTRGCNGIILAEMSLENIINLSSMFYIMFTRIFAQLGFFVAPAVLGLSGNRSTSANGIDAFDYGIYPNATGDYYRNIEAIGVHSHK